jgi:hypothetical protein
LSLYLGTAIAQVTNSYLFIEPSVSLNYDSTIIKIKDRFSNTYYNTESYSVTYLPSNAYVLIDASPSVESPTQEYQDSLIDISINMCNKLDNDTLQIYKEGVAVHYKGFSGFGFIVKDKKEKKYAISFYCSKFYEGGFCTIFYSVSTTDKIDSYEDDKKVLTSIIDGITTYTNKDFEVEDSLLLAKYTISVDSVSRPADLPLNFKRTFFGKVTVKPTLDNKVKGVYVSERYGSQIFTPQPDGQLIIDCFDTQKGTVEKKCELILLNNFGKQVRIPFEFNYINR